MLLTCRRNIRPVLILRQIERLWKYARHTEHISGSMLLISKVDGANGSNNAIAAARSAWYGTLNASQT